MNPTNFKIIKNVLANLVLLASLFFCHAVYAIDFIHSSSSILTAENVAVVINEQNPNSVIVGDYYMKARKIPKKNLVKLSFHPESTTLEPEEFAQIREKMLAKLGPEIQVIVLVWTTPWAVNCNSITSAVTLGYNAKNCSDGCGVGEKNPYFDSDSHLPNQDLKMRISMLIPTDSVEVAKSLIDKGILSDFNRTDATGYFLKTKDEARSRPREQFFPRDLFRVESKKITFRAIHADTIKDKKDIMFYMTGVVAVDNLETLNFLPGAIADHLTSTGGILRNEYQMSSLKWIEAGATGSYGSVSEPCNYWQKFPNPQVLVKHYLAGETLVEAYWKSVYWPAQGLFIGEPLAAPYHQ
jgi:uncharacterized protein (TIGR03790 family)